MIKTLASKCKTFAAGCCTALPYSQKTPFAQKYVVQHIKIFAHIKKK